MQAAPPSRPPSMPSAPPVRQFTPAPPAAAQSSRGPDRGDAPRAMRGGRSDIQDHSR
jgi:hypothetical protein